MKFINQVEYLDNDKFDNDAVTRAPVAESYLDDIEYWHGKLGFVAFLLWLTFAC